GTQGGVLAAEAAPSLLAPWHDERRPLKILLAEDTPANQEIARRILQHRGLFPAEDATRAVQVGQQWRKQRSHREECPTSGRGNPTEQDEEKRGEQQVRQEEHPTACAPDARA